MTKVLILALGYYTVGWILPNHFGNYWPRRWCVPPLCSIPAMVASGWAYLWACGHAGSFSSKLNRSPQIRTWTSTTQLHHLLFPLDHMVSVPLGTSPLG